jgi:hypothetical protein
MKKKLLFLMTLVSSQLSLYSQDVILLNNSINQDGDYAWRNDITYSAKFMGPNALPVPEISRGDFVDFTEIELGGEQHFSIDDKTFNILTNFTFPIVKDRAGLKIHYRPVEFFRTDSSIQDFRAAHDYQQEGFSFGDIYLSTLIQVIKDHEKLPDLLISISLKTASGTNLGNARHTDAPAYYFDASFGKTFQTGMKFIPSWRPYFMAGFYSYQTNSIVYTQNDAFLFGAGFNTTTSLLVIDNQIGGYIGYFGNGDQPVVYRLKFQTRQKSILDYNLSFQFGIHDISFTTLQLSAIVRLEKLRLFWGRESGG